MNDAKVATANTAVCLLGRIVGQAEILIAFRERAQTGDASAERFVHEATSELQRLVKKYRELSRMTARL